MRILDRYILERLLKSYPFILGILVSLYLIVDIFSNLSDILAAKPPIQIIANYYLYMLPLIFLRISPFSLLISVLFSFGELAKFNEIISVRTAGRSILRIALPALYLAAIISVSSLFIQEKILIHSQKKVEDIKVNFIKKNSAVSAAEETNLAFPSANMLIFARKFSPAKETLTDVTIFKKDGDGNITHKIIAKMLIYQQGKWIGKDIIAYELDSEGNIIDKYLHWQEKEIELEEKPKELIFKKSYLSQFSSLKNMRKDIRRFKKIKAYNIFYNLIIDYNQKLAEPFLHFFLIIGVLPLALEIKKRRVALSSMGTGFIFAFMYYCLNSLSIALGKTGLIFPYLAPWLTPLFFFIIGIIGLRLAK